MSIYIVCNKQKEHSVGQFSKATVYDSLCKYRCFLEKRSWGKRKVTTR